MKVHILLFRHLRFVGLAIALCGGLVACGGKTPETLLEAAKGYLAKDDLNAAIIELKNALQKKPDLAEARFLLGKALLEREDPGGAEIELRKASDLKVPADAVAPLLAKALLQHGEPRKVVEQFKAVTLGTPAANAELKTVLASAYADLGARKEADAAIDAALQAMSDYGPAMVLKARVLAGQGDIDAAMAMIRQALQKTPGDSTALHLNGDLLLYGKGDWPAALAAYRAAIAAKNTNYAARAAIISGLMTRNDLPAAKLEIEALRKLRPGHPQTKFFEARMAFQKSDYKVAEEQTRLLLKMVPRSPQVLHLAAALAYQKGSLVEVEQHLTKALAVMPEFGSARLLLAQTYLRSGQPTKAIDVVRPLLESKQPPVQALTIAGAAYMQSGENDRAQGFFERAVKLDPTDLKSRTALAVVGLSQGQGASAFGELESISQSDPGTSADMVLINAHLAKKNFEAALKDIDRLQAKLPNAPFPHFVRGRALLQRGDLAGARSSLEKAVALDPQFFPAVQSLVALDMHDKKPADAEKRYEDLLKAEPNHAQALMASARMKAQSRKPKDEVVGLLNRAVVANPSDVAPRLMLVNYLLQQADHEGALNAAQDASAVFPDSAEVLGALGRAQMASGDLHQAINSFSKAARLLPQSPVPLMALADAYMASGNKAGAADSLRRAQAVAPRNLLVQQKFFEVQLITGRFNEALATVHNVQFQRPKQAIGLSMEGDLEMVRKNWPAAAAAYRNALQREPLPDVAQRLHIALRAAGDTSQAQAMANAWMKSHPRDASFPFYLGTTAVLAQDWVAAERSFQQVISVQPDNAGALNNLAWTTAKLKKPGSLAYAERANSLRPEEPAFMDTLATILAEENKLAKAVEVEKRVVQMRPNEHVYRLNLARILAKAGDKSAARKELEQLAALGDKFADQKEVQQLLSQF